LVKELGKTSQNPRELLVVGLQELGLGKDPSKVTVRYLQPGLDKSQKDIAEFFKQMYNENLGINIKIEYVGWDDFQKKIAVGDYQIASMIWSADYNDPMSELYLWHSDTNIIETGWSNNNYDKLITRAALLGSDKNEE
jgi:oligopeptide transport system substrate-binding protein